MRSKNEAYFAVLKNFITDYAERFGVSPTVCDIASGTGIPRATVSRYITYMCENGMLESYGRRALVTPEFKASRSGSVRVPVLGRVSCGIPKLAEENIEDYVRLPSSLLGGGEFYLLRANGDSMINAGICSGDLVLIKKQSYARSGQIVVALTEDEATLKRFYPEPELERIRLQPENDALSPIYVDTCVIQGIAVKVMKDLV